MGFNQDQGCFAVGTSLGFRVFNTFPFKDSFFRRKSTHTHSSYLEFEGGVALVELIYRSNMMALVGTGAKEEFPPNKVVFWDDSQLKIVGEINFKEKILGMKLREDK